MHESHESFKAVVRGLLAGDPVRHTVALTALARDYPGTLMITLHDSDGDSDGQNDAVVGAVIQVPPYPLITSALPAKPEAAECAAKAVYAVRPDLATASGPLESVHAFRDAWTILTGTEAKLVFSLRLFELGDLEPPQVPGQARLATEADLPLLIQWHQGFRDDTLHGAQSEPVEVSARNFLKPGSITYIWEDDGTPVAFAGARGPIDKMVRVAPVYTPPDKRGHGYASAATAAVSQWALDQGAEHVLLYTDLSNPVTNRIYPRIGYRPLEDSAEYAFTTP
ncbi:GNAT family N-acetyltransferase [Actinocrispum sp. NPDC049592]|uniref:GNAT family N-acetyltransferase n=1 Tax=Actinocrispum sp. NPDC049592 TaxID=3154835 RepID=UPI0034147F98